MATIIDFDAFKFTPEEDAEYGELVRDYDAAVSALQSLASRVLDNRPAEVRQLVERAASANFDGRLELFAQEPGEAKDDEPTYTFDVLAPFSGRAQWEHALDAADPTGLLYEYSPTPGEDDDEADADPA